MLEKTNKKKLEQICPFGYICLTLHNKKPFLIIHFQTKLIGTEKTMPTAALSLAPLEKS
jgi:hypothetical protein